MGLWLTQFIISVKDVSTYRWVVSFQLGWPVYHASSSNHRSHQHGISYDRAIYPPCQCLWTYWVELHGALFHGPTNSRILRIFPCWLKFWHLHISEDMLIDLSSLPNPILLSSLLPSVFHIINPLSLGYADKHILRAGELDMLTVDR